jgi:hypothetical protein
MPSLDLETTLAWLVDAVRDLQQRQEIVIGLLMDLTNVQIEVAEIDKQRVFPAKTMRVRDGTIVRQEVEDGWLVTYLAQDGTTIRDQAFQQHTGEWYAIETTANDELVRKEARGALRVGS